MQLSSIISRFFPSLQRSTEGAAPLSSGSEHFPNLLSSAHRDAALHTVATEHQSAGLLNAQGASLSLGADDMLALQQQLRSLSVQDQQQLLSDLQPLLQNEEGLPQSLNTLLAGIAKDDLSDLSGSDSSTDLNSTSDAAKSQLLPELFAALNALGHFTPALSSEAKSAESAKSVSADATHNALSEDSTSSAVSAKSSRAHRAHAKSQHGVRSHHATAGNVGNDQSVAQVTAAQKSIATQLADDQATQTASADNVTSGATQHYDLSANAKREVALASLIESLSKTLGLTPSVKQDGAADNSAIIELALPQGLGVNEIMNRLAQVGIPAELVVATQNATDVSSSEDQQLNSAVEGSLSADSGAKSNTAKVKIPNAALGLPAELFEESTVAIDQSIASNVQSSVNEQVLAFDDKTQQPHNNKLNAPAASMPELSKSDARTQQASGGAALNAQQVAAATDEAFSGAAQTQLKNPGRNSNTANADSSAVPARDAALSQTQATGSVRAEEATGLAAIKSLLASMNVNMQSVSIEFSNDSAPVNAVSSESLTPKESSSSWSASQPKLSQPEQSIFASGMEYAIAASEKASGEPSQPVSTTSVGVERSAISSARAGATSTNEPTTELSEKSSSLFHAKAEQQAGASNSVFERASSGDSIFNQSTTTQSSSSMFAAQQSEELTQDARSLDLLRTTAFASVDSGNAKVSAESSGSQAVKQVVADSKQTQTDELQSASVHASQVSGSADLATDAVSSQEQAQDLNQLKRDSQPLTSNGEATMGVQAEADRGPNAEAEAMIGGGSNQSHATAHSIEDPTHASNDAVFGTANSAESAHADVLSDAVRNSAQPSVHEAVSETLDSAQTNSVSQSVVDTNGTVQLESSSARELDKQNEFAVSSSKQDDVATTQHSSIQGLDPAADVVDSKSKVEPQDSGSRTSGINEHAVESIEAKKGLSTSRAAHENVTAAARAVAGEQNKHPQNAFRQSMAVASYERSGVLNSTYETQGLTQFVNQSQSLPAQQTSQRASETKSAIQGMGAEDTAQRGAKSTSQLGTNIRKSASTSAEKRAVKSTSESQYLPTEDVDAELQSLEQDSAVANNDASAHDSQTEESFTEQSATAEKQSSAMSGAFAASGSSASAHANTATQSTTSTGSESLSLSNSSMSVHQQKIFGLATNETRVPSRSGAEGRAESMPRVFRVPMDNFAPNTSAIVKNLSLGEGGTAKLILSPEALGTVVVNLNLQESQRSLNIEVANESARQAVESQMPQLREQFAAQGVRVDTIAVQVRDSEKSQSNAGQYQQQHSGQQKQEERDARASFLKSFEQRQEAEPQSRERRDGGRQRRTRQPQRQSTRSFEQYA